MCRKPSTKPTVQMEMGWEWTELWIANGPCGEWKGLTNAKVIYFKAYMMDLGGAIIEADCNACGRLTPSPPISSLPSSPRSSCPSWWSWKTAFRCCKISRGIGTPRKSGIHFSQRALWRSFSVQLRLWRGNQGSLCSKSRRLIDSSQWRYKQACFKGMEGILFRQWSYIHLVFQRSSLWVPSFWRVWVALRTW